MDRLLRFTARNPELSPSMNGAALRVKSPPFGFSTLMTSAPRSARSIPQNGPAMKFVSSSTRTPSSAYFASVIAPSTAAGAC